MSKPEAIPMRLAFAIILCLMFAMLAAGEIGLVIYQCHTWWVPACGIFNANPPEARESWGRK